MAQIYECKMATIITVRIKADDEVQAYDWISTHDFSDVRELTCGYDIDYDDTIIGETNEPENINISEED